MLLQQLLAISTWMAKYYPDDMITDVQERFVISEIVREKLLYETVEEVPHSIACNCVGYEEKKDIVAKERQKIIDSLNQWKKSWDSQHKKEQKGRCETWL